MDLRLKHGEYTIDVINVDKRDANDIAYCAYVSKRNLMWHDGVLFCVCNEVLDTRSLAKLMLTERRILIEQLCWCLMPQYRRTILIAEGNLLVNTPVVKAYGFYKTIAETLRAKAKSEGGD